MIRKHFATVLTALAMVAGVQVANAGAASASTVGIYWDRSDDTGDSHTWTYGDSTWRCDDAWYGDGSDTYTNYVGDTWNDRYSSARFGMANCGVVLYQDAYLRSTYYAAPDKTLRNGSLTNSGVNNAVSSITWS